MKKIIVTENQYTKIQEFVNEDVDSQHRFKFEVEVDVNYNGKISHLVESITAPKMILSYLIDAEYRSWGIKSISLYDIKGPESIELEVQYYESDQEIDPQTKYVQVLLDWENAEKTEENGMGVVCVDKEISIEITENENNDLICKKITIPVYTL
jgi:hypothetical protein